MITLYRTKDCPACTGIEETLRELSLAHEVVVVSGERDDRLPDQSRPPVLMDEGQVAQGSQAILAHLEELEGFKAQWERFQSDACYCDDQGNVE